MILLSKRYDQLSMEKRTLENRTGECEKNVKKLETAQYVLNERINFDISKVH